MTASPFRRFHSGVVRAGMGLFSTLIRLRTAIIATVILGWIVFAAGVQPINVKMASLAPEGSPWHEVLQEIAQDWRELSSGQVRLQIYAGGVLGDESDMVRKMRLNQVQAGALTAEGLSYIDKGIYGLSLPLLVNSYPELDWLRAQVEPELRRRYAKKGFTVLAWADVGWAYWFTRDPVRTPDDLRTQRLFCWAGDPHGPRLWKTTGFHAIFIAGDYEGSMIDCSRARSILGWVPQERPRPAVMGIASPGRQTRD